MNSRPQFAHNLVPASWSLRYVAGTFLACMFAALPATVRAQGTLSAAIGRVEGNDISVDGGPAENGGVTAALSLFVSNGSAVTVHSGQAHMVLVAGGEVDICGPAKFTLLQSGNSITLALNFGRMRVQLPADTALRVFTPTIIATPLDINGARRVITAGLDLNDSLCILAMSGAIRLEHQFTGETLVIPQAGEFSLAGGKLVPVADAPGSCQCNAAQTATIPPAQPVPEAGLTSPAILAPPVSEPVNQPPADELAREFSIPAHANEAHPIAPPLKTEVAAPPPDVMPTYKIVMPPLTFSASSPAMPPDPGPDMILLVREAQVAPEWEFTGHVQPPQFVDAAPHSAPRQPQAQPSQESVEKKRGFWAVLKRLFVGSETLD